MTEPKYDDDVVNLGYLNKVLNNNTSSTASVTISRHFMSKPNTPYYSGDTWKDGNIFYTCINSRLIGLYNDNDWVSESGAKEEAKSKNKIFLNIPFNYSVGDMWLLQSDTEHEAGKKGEFLICTTTRQEYNKDDWINNVSYGDVTSQDLKNKTNEIQKNLEDKINNEIEQLANNQEKMEEQLNNKISISSLQTGTTDTSNYSFDDEHGLYYINVMFLTAFETIPTVFLQDRNDNEELQNIVSRVGNVTENGFTIFLDNPISGHYIDWFAVQK